MDCIFCKIAKKEIPSTIIYEDKDFIAFLDLFPINKGHVLIIPKKHYQNLLDVPKKEASNLLIACQKIASAVVKATNSQGFNLLMNNGPVAGQEVPHAHIHIIPRFENDNKSLKHTKEKYGKGEEEAISSKIKSLL